MTVLIVLLAAVVALLGVLVAGLLRSHAEILRALHSLGVSLDPDPAAAGAPVGASAPILGRAARSATDLVGVTPSGDAISIGVVDVGHPTLLAFLTSGCTTCEGFWSAFSNPNLRDVPGDARLVVVTKGAEAESPARLTKFAPPDVPVVMSSEAWDAFDVPGAPYFAFVDGPSGTVVGEGAASTWDHVRSMLERALADAGVSTRRGRRPRISREARVDDQLLRAGLTRDDPSLYPRSDADLQTGPDGGGRR